MCLVTIVYYFRMSIELLTLRVDSSLYESLDRLKIYSLSFNRLTKNVQAAAAAAKIPGIEKVFVAESDALKGQVAEAVSAVLLDVQSKNNYSHILANGTVFGKVQLV